MGKALGDHLRNLRHKKGTGLKRSAPGLDLSYTYLSKIENGLLDPFPETLARLAAYYGVDVHVLEVLSGRLPDDLLQGIQSDPETAIRILREHFGE
jgi:transcriptional regulator with XRE-family HTH domain